jgi:hypothetical protein
MWLAQWLQMLLRTVVVLHLQDDPEVEDILILLIERCKWKIISTSVLYWPAFLMRLIWIILGKSKGILISMIKIHIGNFSHFKSMYFET